MNLEPGKDGAMYPKPCWTSGDQNTVGIVRVKAQPEFVAKHGHGMGRVAVVALVIRAAFLTSDALVARWWSSCITGHFTSTPSPTGLPGSYIRETSWGRPWPIKQSKYGVTQARPTPILGRKCPESHRVWFFRIGDPF